MLATAPGAVLCAPVRDAASAGWGAPSICGAPSAHAGLWCPAVGARPPSAAAGSHSVAFPARVRRPPRHVARSERRLRPSASPALPFRRGSETSSPIRSESFGPWGKPGPGGGYRTEKLTTVSSGPELSSSESPRPVKRQAGGVFRSRRASRRAPVVASPPPPGSHGEPDSWWPLTPRLPSKRASS